MKNLRNQKGSVLIFVTLMIVLLLVMVGMGLDTGQLTYTRATAQPAVDAAALAAASAVPTGDINQVRTRATLFNGSNTYTDSKDVQIQASDVNVTLMKYTPGGTPELQTATMATANAARVALETTNPYTSAASTPVKSPLFLTPLFNLMGIGAQKSAQISVNAVAVTTAMVGLPMAVEVARCSKPNPQHLLQSSSGQGNNQFNDNSGYTTYWINNTNPNTIQDFLGASDSCSGGLPGISGVGFCTQLNNGQITSVYDDFANLFNNNPGKCYLMPVVADGSDWSHCQNILYFATWCPDATTPVVKSGNDKYLLGNLTCPTDPNTVNPSLKCYTQVLVRDKTSGM